MQFKVTGIIALLVLIFIGVSLFLFLRKKSSPDDESDIPKGPGKAPDDESDIPKGPAEAPESATLAPLVPEQPTPTTTPAQPLVPPNPPEPESRMGWPVGTIWNIKGVTGNDAQKCNDICKCLGYNYFTHNPPPHDGGCGCFRSGLKLSRLNMTDHVNAKTRRVGNSRTPCRTIV